MAKLKISADTSDAKKSILDLGKQFKDMKTSGIAVFTAEDKKFIKTQFKKQMEDVKAKIKESGEELAKMVKIQQNLVEGSEDELRMRNKILEAYKKQSKMAQDLGKLQKGSKDVGKAGGNAGEGFMGKMFSGAGTLLSMLPKALGVGALATAGMGVARTIQGTGQYNAGVGQRNRLQGLGVDDQNFGSAKDLARVGMTEQEMIDRRIEATGTLGRSGTNNDTEMRKASFERAYGLEGGTMTGVASSMRGQVGGAGATDVQMKLQASILAAGIEDAIGPYLQSAVTLLTAINENGTANTTEMTSLMAQLTKDGERTPEQLAKNFAGVNSAVQGASGDASAFLQTAFAKGGIGGGTVGGTKMAMSSGGITGMSRAELEKRGYNKQLLDQMESSGYFAGVGQRSGAILNQFKQSGGMSKGQSISGISNMNQMVGMGNMANSVFGTKGEQGFDVLQMLEKVQNKQMSQKQFDSKLKEMQEAKDPSVQRLDKINTSLSGQTEVLNNINNNLLEALGKQGVVGQNALTKGDNQIIGGATNLAGAVNSTGAVEGAGNAAQSMGEYINSGGLGKDIYDDPEVEKRRLDRATSDDMVNEQRSKLLQRAHPDWDQNRIDQHIKDKPLNGAGGLTAKAIGKEVAEALKKAPIQSNVNNQITMPDGSVTERTNK